MPEVTIQLETLLFLSEGQDLLVLQKESKNSTRFRNTC